MADFKEVAKQYARMCNTYPNCGRDCPINKFRPAVTVCRYWTLMENPETAEKVIMDWADKHPPVTNRDKFKEIFGFDFSYKFNASLHDIAWLDGEYKEPEK